jgi:hypothetical protein
VSRKMESASAVSLGAEDVSSSECAPLHSSHEHDSEHDGPRDSTAALFLECVHTYTLPTMSLSLDYDNVTIRCEDWLGQCNDEFPLQFWTVEKNVCQVNSMTTHDTEHGYTRSPGHLRSYIPFQLGKMGSRSKSPSVCTYQHHHFHRKETSLQPHKSLQVCYQTSDLF